MYLRPPSQNSFPTQRAAQVDWHQSAIEDDSIIVEGLAQSNRDARGLSARRNAPGADENFSYMEQAIEAGGPRGGAPAQPSSSRNFKSWMYKKLHN